MAFFQDLRDCANAALKAAVSRWRFIRDMRRGVSPDQSPHF